MKIHNPTPSLSLLAVCDGEVIALADMPDEVFSSGMLGRGYAIIPEGRDFFAPVGGRVLSVSPTSHAYVLATADDISVLIHIGIDTVTLNSAEISSRVRVGDEISAGAPLAVADIDSIAAAGLSPITAVTLTSGDSFASAILSSGSVLGGVDIALEFKP